MPLSPEQKITIARTEYVVGLEEENAALLNALKEPIASQEQLQRENNLDDLAKDMFAVTNAIAKAKQEIAKAEGRE